LNTTCRNLIVGVKSVVHASMNMEPSWVIARAFLSRLSDYRSSSFKSKSLY
jgi:hypothetical protein